MDVDTVSGAVSGKTNANPQTKDALPETDEEKITVRTAETGHGVAANTPSKAKQGLPFDGHCQGLGRGVKGRQGRRGVAAAPRTAARHVPTCCPPW